MKSRKFWSQLANPQDSLYLTNTHYTLRKSLDHVVTTLYVSFPANLSGYIQDQNFQYTGQAGQVAAIYSVNDLWMPACLSVAASMEKSSRIVHVQGGDKQRETSLLIWWRGREFKRFRLCKDKKGENDEEKCT